MSRSDRGSLLLRFFTDLVSIGLLSLMVARRRPRRGLFMVCSAFNSSSPRPWSNANAHSRSSAASCTSAGR